MSRTLAARLLAAAVRRPHVLLVPVPGHANVYRAAEDALDVRGWPRALSPAAADVLLECGPAGPELSRRVDAAYEAMPGPRALALVDDVGRLEAGLDQARQRLADLRAQHDDARDRGGDGAGPDSHDPAGMDTAGMDHDMPGMDMAGMDHDMPGMDMAGMDHDMDMSGMDHDMDMSGMDHDMAGMDMSLPGGLVMADRVPDRDGLRLEGLRQTVGPILPGWPAGLELTVTLSGDVLTEVSAQVLDQPPMQADPTGPLDALLVLLAAAGWDDLARRGRRARREGEATAVEALLRRTEQARVLRWSLRGLPGPAGRDLVAHLDALVAAVRDRAAVPRASLHELQVAVTGLDLASAAPVVAAFGPCLERVGAHA